jgi:hypothetical protein
MRSMQWEIGFLGTISAFARRQRKTKKPGVEMTVRIHTDFQSAVRQTNDGIP